MLGGPFSAVSISEVQANKHDVCKFLIQSIFRVVSLKCTINQSHKYIKQL